MKRRIFIASAGAAALAGTDIRRAESAPVKPRTRPGPVRDLAGKSLKDLREEFRFWLFDDYLPFADAHIIDHELGGFMCSADRDGSLLSTEKRSGYLGRGLWVYSRLYRALGRDQKHLETARKTLEFLLKGRPADGSLWPPSFTKEGTPVGTAPKSVNTELYIAEGIAEYARAANSTEHRKTARDILFKCLRIYDTPGYLADAGRGYSGADAAPSAGVTLLDDFMLFLRLATVMLDDAPDPDIEAVAKRCTTQIAENFYNPEFGLLNEMINQDLSRPVNAVSQLVTFGNIFQALWHSLDEAARTKDRTLFETNADRLRRHIEVAWDDVYGGLFGTLRNVNDNLWELAKINYVQAESLNGLLLVIEHTGAEWARDWYDRIRSYTMENFPLRKYGFPLWNVSGDRKATFVRKANRFENFHHPRHLILSLEALDRIIKRNGKVSGVFG